MSDDPQPNEPERPLSRRELRERAQAEAATRSAQELAEPTVETAEEAGGQDAILPGDAENVDPESEGAEPLPAAPDAGAQQAAGPRRRARTDAAQAPSGPTMPEGSSIEALLHRDPEPEKPRRGKGCLIAVIIVVVVLGGIAAGGVWAWNTYGERIQEALGIDGPHDFEEGEATGEAMITVEEGDTGESLSPRLHEEGVTLESDSFTRYLRENDLNPMLYPGVYKLQQKMTSAAVVTALEDEDNRQENAVQLPEGLTVDASVERIAESVGVPRKDLEKAVADPSAYGVDADRLEGWLFPATYTFEPEASADEIIRTMVDRTRESLASAGVPDSEVDDVLTIASIVQREARFDDDFYKVSRVIHNRLDPDTWGDTGGLLQMDSTSQYGYGEHHSGSASSSAEALKDDNPWNTYKVVGLPAGPIANPGDLAIDAAMNPADGPWLYFVTVNLNTGETKFADSYAEQQGNVSEWREWCSENPDAGC